MNDMNRKQSEKNTAGQQEANAALAALAATGNAFALGQLWEINKGLLRSMFWKWYPSHREQADAHGLTADDFEQEGYFAVKYAAEHYDPGKGFAFSTWLAYAMKRQIDQTLTGGHRRKITDPDGKTRTTSADPLNHCTSLDLPMDAEDEAGATRADLVPDPAAAAAFEDAEQALFIQQLHEDLERALAKLDPRQADALRGKYYLGYTLRQLAESMGISLERARQLQAKGMTAMRRHETLLRPYLEEICTTHAYRGTGFSAWAYGGSVEERTVERLEREQRQFARSTARQLARMLEEARQERGDV